MIEEWKDIPGYEGSYQVSNFGNVKSLNYNKTGKEQLLKPGSDKDGYLKVIFTKNGRKSYTIHQLVAICFLEYKGYNETNMVINHIDNCKTNNISKNLEIVPIRYNSICHKLNKGIYKDGDRWKVQINIDNKKINLGRYKDEDKEKALQIYQRAFENVHLYDGDNSKFRELINS
jgi:hypothetical protein